MALRWLTTAQIVRFAGVVMVLCTVIHSLRAAPGPPVEIINRADLAFFAPAGVSNFLSSDPVRTLVQAGGSSTLSFRNATYDQVVSVSGLQDLLYVQVAAPPCVTNPLVIQSNLVVLRSERTGDREEVISVETGPGTGIFRLLTGCPLRDGARFPPMPNNGFMEVVAGDVVTAESDGCSSGLIATTVLIDPGGVIFDSRTGAAIAGATVTLIDAASGLPAIVFEMDGRTPAPSTVTTGPDGRYSFPAVNAGVYRLVVVPPPGYTAPSKVPVASLPPSRFVGDPASYGGNFPVNLATGPVRVDVPVDAVEAAAGTGLFVQRLASRATAEIGDLVEFTVRVRNVSGAALTAVLLKDQLPAGFTYEKRSARLENKALADPSGGSTLQFNLGLIAQDATVTLTYLARIGPGAMQGDGVSWSQARADNPTPIKSNVATVEVRIVGGVFAEEGFILGKVFVDANTNRVQDPGEPGVPGVRLFIEDGTYVITDGEGKYSLYGLRPRTHVIKLDNFTLPPGARLEVLSVRNALSAGTRFVDLKKGELHKADFAIVPASPEVLEEIKERRKKLDGGGAEVGSAINNKLTPDGALPLRGDPRGQPASGTVTGSSTPGPSAAGNAAPLGTPPGRPAATPTSSDAVPGSNRVRPLSTNSLPVAGASPPPPGDGAATTNGPGTLEHLRHVPSGDPVPLPIDHLPHPDPVAPPPNFSSVLLPDLLNDRNSNLPPAPIALIEPIPTDGLVLTLTNLDNSIGFADLKDGDILPMAQATIRVKGQYGATIALRVNGDLVPASRLGRRAAIADRQIEAWEFVGITLRPGTNRLEAAQYDSFGNARGSQAISVIAPDKLARIRVLLPKIEQRADGHSNAKIEVRLEDARGISVTARTPITLETSRGRWQTPDLDTTTRGTQLFIEGGRAEFPLLAPLEPGDARIVISSGVISGDATLSFLPDLRPMLAVGIIEGQLSLNKLDLRSLVPARSNDGFEEELRDFSVSGNDGKFNAAGRAAFFLKGKIKGEYLLTAGYDSEKQTRERLFRDIQPDEFYPVYGDSSVRGFDAQSSGRLYVRIDKRKCYLLYGDLLTSSASEVRGLGNYSRSLTGVRGHYERSNVVANVWASQDRARQVIEELPANGTSGPYQFQTANGIVNSEKVEILTRDRDQPSLILKTETLARFQDYEFEPFTGRILFKAPIPSLDANLNPVSIRVTYETDQGGDKFWVYGADAQLKVHKRVEVGGAAVRDENPQGDYGLYSANATVQLAPKTFVLGEVARSETDLMEGNAWRLDARHSSGPFDARIYYGRADNTFSNTAAVITGGRIEGGAKASYRFTKSTRLVLNAITTESIDNHGVRQGVVGGVEHTFANQMKLELGARYSDESLAPASASTVGATPNEVTSVRAKLTTPVPYVKGASIYGEYENDVLEPDKRLAAVGGEYQLRTRTRLYARTEFINSLGGPFELSTSQQRNTTVFGIDTAYMKDASVFSEYRAREALSSREAESALGLRNLWDVAPGLRLHTTFERITPIEGGDQNEATAGTAAVEYTRNPESKATARVEVRSATQNDSFLNTLGYARKLSRDWTFLGRTILYLVDDKGPSDANKIQARFQAGLAWRQTQTDRWSALMKYEFKVEDGDVLSNAELHRRVNILSLHANYQPTADWLLSGHYAGKLAFEETGSLEGWYDAHLLSFRASYDLTKRLDVGLNTAALFDGGLRGIQYAIGPEIGFTLYKNLRVGIGYNFTGFNDRDLSVGDYTQQGVYLALRLKFDEETLGFGRKKEAGK